MELTAENVQKIMFDCFFKNGEDTSNHVKGQGIRGPMGFNPVRLEHHKADIQSLLNQLPNEFMETGGGGYSFLNGCMTSNGNQWGEQSNVDELICLGVAIGKVSFPMPREMWSFLPGGMPYFVVHNRQEKSVTQ